MSGRVLGLLAAACAMVMVGCARDIPAPRAEPTLREGLPAAIAEAVRVREVFGLRADADYVTEVAADPQATTDLLGIPLTPVEADALRRRFAAQDHMGNLIAYGAEHPDEFGGLYIDQQAGGEVVVQFTDSLARHRIAVRRLAPPGVSVTVRKVDFTERELSRLLDEVTRTIHRDGLEPISAGVDVVRNVVSIDGKSNVPGIEQLLEARYRGMVDVTVYPVPGPWANAESGDGWRLLIAVDVDSSHAYTVRAATDATAADAIWNDLGLSADAPNVDFTTEFVATFGYGHGSTCREARLDGVVIDRDHALVYAEASDPLGPRACTTDLSGAWVFVVAIERSAIPGDVATIRLNRERICIDCGHSDEVKIRLD